MRDWVEQNDAGNDEHHDADETKHTVGDHGGHDELGALMERPGDVEEQVEAESGAGQIDGVEEEACVEERSNVATRPRVRDRAPGRYDHDEECVESEQRGYGKERDVVVVEESGERRLGACE